ncbi:MAG: hypothetical protein FJX70_08170 [Alphaproteobacteria bacterium]|nr:hypothetical protein [Alphaproteobacteria bacterium]
MPIDKGTSKPITQLSGLQINYKDKYSCFNPPIVTTEERDALINTDDPAKPIKDGTMVYNSNDKSVQAYQEEKWVNVGGSAPIENVVTSAENGTLDYLVAYANNDRTVKDSGVKISEVKKTRTKKEGIDSTPLYQLSNLGALQFGSNENVADTGTILVDGLTPVTFQTQGTGAEARICTVINGELGAGSSSPSALLEINSSEGGFLHARMTTAERDALLDPKDGLEIYNTDTKNLNIRQDGSWVEIKSGGNGNVVGPTTSVLNSLAVWTTSDGKKLGDTGKVVYIYGSPSFGATSNFIGTFSNSTGMNIDLNNIKLTARVVDISDRGTPMMGGILTISEDQAYSITLNTNMGNIYNSPEIVISSYNDGGLSNISTIKIKKSTAQLTNCEFIFPPLMPQKNQVLTAVDNNGTTTWGAKNQLTYYKFNDETNDLKILSKDKHIATINTTSKEQRIILDKLSTDDQGHYFIIKDETGNASKNNIVIDGNGALIDGEEQYIINVDYGCITVCYTGSSWAIIGFYCTKG